MPIVLDGTAGIDNDATDLSYTGTLTGGTGVVNLGSGQFVKDASGNVGIGTDAPATLLHVSGSETTAIGRIANSSSGAAAFNGSGAGLELLAGGMNTTNKYTPAIKFGSTDVDFTTTNPKFGAAIIAEATSTYATDTNGGMALSFWTSPNAPGTGSGLVERMRIDSAGNVLIGATATVNTDFGAKFIKDNTASTVLAIHRQSSNGDVARFSRGGNDVGSISVTSTETTYNTSSDYRLKHDITPMTGALAKVAQLKPCTYKWNADDSNGEGFIAHELQAVVPECVTGDKDAVDANGNPVYQGIDTSFLVATLTAAIQEQQAIIESLTARVVALEQA